MPDIKQKSTEVVEKMEFYQPGVNELRRQLLEILPSNKVDSLVSPMDYELALFEVATYLRHTGKRPEDAKNLFYYAIDYVIQKHKLDPDIGEAAKLRIGKNPKEFETLTNEILEENPSEQTDDPSNHHLNDKPNEFFEKIQNSSEDVIKEINKRFKKSPVGEKIAAFEESTPTIATTPTSTAVGLTVTGGVVGGVVTTNKISALATLPGSPVGNIPQTINYGKGFVGFSVANNAELVSQFSSAAHFQSYFGAGIFKQIPQSAVAQIFGFAPQPNTTYIGVTEKYFRTFNLSPKSLTSVMNGIASRPGVTMVATGGKTITSTVTSTATKAALTAKAGSAAGAAIGSATPVVGTALGAIIGSQLPKIWNWIKEHLSPVLGGLVFSGILGLTGSVPLAATGGLLTAGGTAITSSAISGFGTGIGTGSASVSSAGAGLGLFFTSLAGEVATTSIMPVVVTVFVTPIIIAFFLIIINSGAYIVPPAGRHSGPGGLYPSCWPLDTGVITQLPPHGLTQRLDAFDIGTNQQNGIPVYATHDGTVHNFTDPNTPSQGSYGTYVKVVSDEGFCTLYGHLASHSRSEGETVFAGDEIGLSDNTGTSTGPHLHYEYQEPCTSYAGVIPGSTLITNYVPPGYTLGGSIQYSGSCFASQQGGSATAP